jgi:hypothetical protein
MTHRDEPICPMTLGNMRQNGVRGLFVTCGLVTSTLLLTSMPGLTTSRYHRLGHACGARSAASLMPPRDY